MNLNSDGTGSRAPGAGDGSGVAPRRGRVSPGERLRDGDRVQTGKVAVDHLPARRTAMVSGGRKSPGGAGVRPGSDTNRGVHTPARRSPPETRRAKSCGKRASEARSSSTCAHHRRCNHRRQARLRLAPAAPSALTGGAKKFSYALCQKGIWQASGSELTARQPALPGMPLVQVARPNHDLKWQERGSVHRPGPTSDLRSPTPNLCQPGG